MVAARVPRARRVIGGTESSSTPSGPRGALPRTAVRRSRSLPGGRAVVGGFLVAAATVGGFAAASGAAHPPSSRVVVAARPMAYGHVIEAGDLTTVAIAVPSAMEGKLATNPAAMVGRTLLGPVAKGETVAPSLAIAAGDSVAERQIALPVEASRMVGGLQRNERVDVVATFGTGSSAHTDLVLAGARVVAVDRDEDSISRSTATVVVAVRDVDAALRLANAVTSGEIVLLRSTAAPAG